MTTPTSTKDNVIIQMYREEVYDGSAYDTHEWLFQLARVWTEWQSSRIGTFPMDWRDQSGPVDREWSEDTGEDNVYWTIVDALERITADDKGETVQDTIVQATTILDRLDDCYSANGRGI